MGKVFKTKLNIKSRKTEEALKKFAGSYRFVFNKVLDYQWYKMSYCFDYEDQVTNTATLIKVLNMDKHLYPFLNEVDIGLIYTATRNSNKSFRRWHMLHHCISLSFRNQKFPLLPKYVARKTEGMRFSSRNVKIFYDHIKIPRVGEIKLYEKGYLPQGEKVESISFSHDGKDWWISVKLLDSNEKRSVNKDTHLWADFTKEGKLITQDKVYENIIDSASYQKELKKQKKLVKKLKRQKNANTLKEGCGRLVVRTSRNMMKTRKRIVQSRNKMDRIKKDYFQKVINELAKTKPSEVHLLSRREISTQRNDYRTRHLMESGTSIFAEMLSRKLRALGASINRHSDHLDIDKHLCVPIFKGGWKLKVS